MSAIKRSSFPVSGSLKSAGSKVALATFTALFFSQLALAETSDFGGYATRFKGRGDRVPPRCQLNVPNATTEPFFVKWNCDDEGTLAADIRSELWLYRNGSQTGELVGNFIGFPASVFVDRFLLHSESVASGLPAGFKLVARDRAGNAAISPVTFTRAQDNALGSCSLAIVTEASDSTDETTGTPALEVNANNVGVTVSQTSTLQLSLSSKSTAFASPCEIDTVCFDGARLTFSSTLTLGSGDKAGEAEGTVSVIPGSLVVPVKGSASVDGTELQNLSVSGETKIDNQKATVTLTCDR